jgi:hypothetical protein
MDVHIPVGVCWSGDNKRRKQSEVICTRLRQGRSGKYQISTDPKSLPPSKTYLQDSLSSCHLLNSDGRPLALTSSMVLFQVQLML